MRPAAVFLIAVVAMVLVPGKGLARAQTSATPKNRVSRSSGAHSAVKPVLRARAMGVPAMRSQTASASTSHSRAPEQSVAAVAKRPLMANGSIARGASPRAAAGALPSAVEPKGQFHRGPYAATLGGPASPKAATAGTLSGTRMNRKP